ncbi:MAG TPA: hypothetical protein VJ926_03350 [Patescibacteria group bacterium]|nr:hypothetical protein [Patescibacteria group bacterium]
MSEKFNQQSKMKIDKPHEPFGKHVDIITPFGKGADKMRIGTEGQILSHEMNLKGGHKINIK